MRQALFLNDFTVLDFAFFGPMGLQGESLWVSAELLGTLDGQGFIFDFGPAKNALKKCVDEALDHKLVVPQVAEKPKGWELNGFCYQGPQQAVTSLDCALIGAEVLENFLSKIAGPYLPENVTEVRFVLRADSRFLHEPNFRYTHGLRKHDGNCQRLFHGHRNPIEVFLHGRRIREAEENLAHHWSDAHFAAVDTVENFSSLGLSLGLRNFGHAGRAHISYTSPQGAFWAELPANRLICLENEPSIENIAKLGYDYLVARGFDKNIRVKAFEGLNKGSVYGLS